MFDGGRASTRVSGSIHAGTHVFPAGFRLAAKRVIGKRGAGLAHALASGLSDPGAWRSMEQG
ncbi:MAG TPA: hypothetical protein VFJ16_04440, partial [Longimicrobium sp.]|nr:hypothetical protein [Longimicrobium sp.]